MYKELIRNFGKFGTKHLKGYFLPLREEILKSNLNMLFELYVGKMMLATIITFMVGLIFLPILMLFLGFPLVISIISGLITAVTFSFIILTLFHSYPFQLQTMKKNSIENNMPFAINHMGAIAASGIPPFTIFKLLSNVSEYGEIRNEAGRIVRNTETFGMDITAAIKNVADRTPSSDFRQFLIGILSTIQTYADFYTAVLIAAPLFFVSILSVMSLIGGEIMGMSIPMAMSIGIYLLIPLLNTIFLLFIHFTQVKI
jgi:flagellar protein FlaJ